MQPIQKLNPKSIQFVFTDIDDTLTHNGHIEQEAFNAIWSLFHAGIHVIPVTGRPAGWCEMIARSWPVAGVIGENGGFYFRYKNRTMHRHFFNTEEDRQKNQNKLLLIEAEALKSVKGCAVASDQFCRLMDLAIDFCEDVPPLPTESIQKIVSIFEKHGATAKVSSIHVNGWFGDYDKLSMAKTFCKKEFQLELDQILDTCIFVGDSPNDEPMFEYFSHSIGVSNLQAFSSQIEHQPKFITSLPRGRGFAEAVAHILKSPH